MLTREASARVRYPAAERLTAARSLDELRTALLSEAPPLARKISRLAILGAGPEGARLVETCRARGIDIAGLYDGNARKRNSKLAGLTIYPSEALTRLPKDVPIIVASHRTLGACESLRG